MGRLFKEGKITSAGIAVWNTLSSWLMAITGTMIAGGMNPTEVSLVIMQVARDVETKGWGILERLKSGQAAEGAMMHYKDGTQAKLGDVVRGVGYNLKKHEAGVATKEQQEFEGVVVGLVPGSDSCNIRVAFLSAAKRRKAYSFTGDPAQANWETFEQHAISMEDSAVMLDLEYGATKDFVKVR